MLHYNTFYGFSSFTKKNTLSIRFALNTVSIENSNGNKLTKIIEVLCNYYQNAIKKIKF